MSLYITITIILLLIIWVLWRFSSNRHTLPCPSWLSWLVELDNPFAKAHQARSIINSLRLFEKINVLDIGCGPGRVSLPLAQRIASKKGRVVAMDLQSEMLEKTKKRAALLDITNIDFIHGPIDQVTLEKEAYDVVLLVCVLGEIPDSDRPLVLSKIASTIKPNGILSVTETIFDPHFQKRQTVIELMNHVGLKPQYSFGGRFVYTIHFVHSH